MHHTGITSMETVMLLDRMDIMLPNGIYIVIDSDKPFIVYYYKNAITFIS